MSAVGRSETARPRRTLANTASATQPKVRIATPPKSQPILRPCTRSGVAFVAARELCICFQPRIEWAALLSTRIAPASRPSMLLTCFIARIVVPHPKKEPPREGGGLPFGPWITSEDEAEIQDQGAPRVVPLVGIQQDRTRQIVPQPLEEEAVDRVVLPAVSEAGRRIRRDPVVEAREEGKQLDVLVVEDVDHLPRGRAQGQAAREGSEVDLAVGLGVAGREVRGPG